MAITTVLPTNHYLHVSGECRRAAPPRAAKGRAARSWGRWSAEVPAKAACQSGERDVAVTAPGRGASRVSLSRALNSDGLTSPWSPLVDPTPRRRSAGPPGRRTASPPQPGRRLTRPPPPVISPRATTSTGTSVAVAAGLRPSGTGSVRGRQEGGSGRATPVLVTAAGNNGIPCRVRACRPVPAPAAAVLVVQLAGWPQSWQGPVQGSRFTGMRRICAPRGVPAAGRADGPAGWGHSRGRSVGGRA